MKVWRLLKTKYAKAAFDGEGARLYGARWNSVGTRVAYASSSSALAILEVLVHLDDATLLPAYSLVEASVPDALIEDLDPSVLPADWTAFPPPGAVQAIGDSWIRSGRSLGLRVPSVLAPSATNLLINPAHAGARRVIVHAIAPYEFDPRFMRR
jgi:RES domain-containing protein